MLVNPRHAFGVDDIALANILARGQIVFFVWVTLTEHKWVILAERRGKRLQTAVSGLCRETMVVNVTVKRRGLITSGVNERGECE